MKVTAVIEDLSGIGNMSLVTALDIFHALNITTAALPATILSTQSEGFGQPAVIDTVAQQQFQQRSLAHWQSVLDVQIDSILVGYLGLTSTVDLVNNWINQTGNNASQVIIDPVMGDRGHLYPGLSEELINKMRQLILNASVITPNLTELELLCADSNNSDAVHKIPEYLRFLQSIGFHGDCIITGIPNHAEIISQLWAETPTNYHVLKEFRVSRLSGHFYGTGDVFAACFAALLGIGQPKTEAFENANHLVSIAIQETATLPDKDRKYGLLMHNLLQKLSNYNIRK